MSPAGGKGGDGANGPAGGGGAGGPSFGILKIGTVALTMDASTTVSFGSGGQPGAGSMAGAAAAITSLP
jgi:hypothetical protein